MATSAGRGGGPTLPISAAVASPLALIVNELVTNTMRHAFPDIRYGKVTLSYAEDGGRLVFSVADDGIGFDVNKPSAGRGRPAITMLVRELGGTITWTSSSEGTSVEGQIPLQPSYRYAAENAVAVPGPR